MSTCNVHDGPWLGATFNAGPLQQRQQMGDNMINDWKHLSVNVNAELLVPQGRCHFDRLMANCLSHFRLSIFYRE